MHKMCNNHEIFDSPVNVELVNIRTIFELRIGKFFKDPIKTLSSVLSSIPQIQ
jgi:hypothetical protein